MILWIDEARFLPPEPLPASSPATPSELIESGEEEGDEDGEGLEGVGEVELGNSSLNADLCRPIRRGGGGELAPAWSLESAGVTAGETVSVRSSERIIAGPGLGREDVEMNLLGSTSEEDRVSRDLHWRDRVRDSMIRSH